MIEALNKKLIKRNHGDSPPISTGLGNAECYLLVDFFGDCLLWVDAIVNAALPINDFNVNSLSWDANEFELYTLSYQGVTQVLASIDAKKAEITDEYYELLFCKNCPKSNTACS